MDEKLTVQEALAQLLKENMNFLANGQVLTDALLKRASVTPLNRAFYTKAFAEGNIGEIFAVVDFCDNKSMAKARKDAVKKIRRIVRADHVKPIVKTLVKAIKKATKDERKKKFEEKLRQRKAQKIKPTETQIVQVTEKNVIKGERLTAPETKLFKIGFLAKNVPNEMEIDAYAFALHANGCVESDDDMVFFNNPQHITGGIYVDSAAKIAGIGVELGLLPANIERIAVCFAIYDEDISLKRDFSQVNSPEILLFADNNICYKFPLQLTNEKIITALEFYRYQKVWKIKFTGGGYREGLKKICESYGLEVV